MITMRAGPATLWVISNYVQAERLGTAPGKMQPGERKGCIGCSNKPDYCRLGRVYLQCVCSIVHDMQHILVRGLALLQSPKVSAGLEDVLGGRYRDHE
jgi:hypothetical protein